MSFPGRPFSLSSRSDFQLLILCVVVSLGLLALPQDLRVLVADRLGLVMTEPYFQVRNFGQDVIETRDRNAWLARRVLELEMQAAAEQRLIRDLDRMAGPAVEAGYAGDLVPCRVVMRQRARFANMIKIYSLVEIDWQTWQPVVSGTGLLGRVRAIISPREAWVELLTSPDFAVGVELERTGLLGVLRPRADRFELEMIGRDEDVRPGDKVITSGVAEIRDRADAAEASSPTPRGFPVGVVTTVSSPSDQIFKRVVVRPAANLKFNETVYVVVPLDGGFGSVGDRP